VLTISAPSLPTYDLSSANVIQTTQTNPTQVFSIAQTSVAFAAVSHGLGKRAHLLNAAEETIVEKVISPLTTATRAMLT
jgi:hypothetical protein